MKIKTLEDVRKWRLCLGCGVCKAVCTKNAVQLKNIENEGIRPFVKKELCQNCETCLATCSGIKSKLKEVEYGKRNRKKFAPFGYYINIYEGYALNESIRTQASSGGAATALALFCLENGITESVINIGQDQDDSCVNKSQICSTYEQLLNSTGSRYSPSSPCEVINEPVQNGKKATFIGKPCDVAAVRNAQAQNPQYKQSISPLISIFCAGTPSTKGIREYLKEQNIDSKGIRDLRYRGYGWPGYLSFMNKNKESRTNVEPYEKVWDYLQRYRPLRCYLCADGTGETADISCGDAWHLDVESNQPGVSLIITRTENGQRIVEDAQEKGYLYLKKSSLRNLLTAQAGLFARKQELFGRFLLLRLFGIPIPQYIGWPLFYLWRTSSPLKIFTSIASTVKRIITRRLFKPMPIEK